MSKNKVIIISISVFLGVIIVIVGVLFAIRSSKSSDVNVYAVSDFSSSDSGSMVESYGSITSDNMQSVYISETQQVTEIYVSEGQEVKVGDKLLSYDTTLTDLELQKKDNEIQKLELQIDTAEKKLAEIKNYKPYVPKPPIEPSEPEEPEEPEDPVISPVPSMMGGSGTNDDPYKYLWDYTCSFSEEFVNTVLGENTEAYVNFYIYDKNSLECEKLASFGIHFSRTETGYGFLMYEVTDGLVETPEENDTSDKPTDDYVEEDDSSGYTAADIAKMRAEKEAEIVTLNLSLKMAKVVYEEMKQEMDSGVVVSKFDGTVSTVTDVETALAQNIPLLKVSGGGGYYIKVAVGEFDRNVISIGQQVDINSWETGTFAVGEITEISDIPTTDNAMGGQGNTNVSYYPFTVFVSEEYDFKENEYVGVSYSVAEEGSTGIYIESAFILRENGKTFMYIDNNGILERREVVTGKSLWGSYMEIKSGLTYEDYMAFPYGSNVKEGAKTVQATPDKLYAY
jgi:HlyD family secretion protein